MTDLLISVVIPTFNRAELLRASLESLACQSLGLDRFEVIVVDDGSADATRDVCAELSKRLRLKYFPIVHSGTSAAKNLGIFVSSAPILLFFDDDDYAAPTLLQEHLAAHRRHPQEQIAVLGYTTWAPWLPVTDVMDYVMNVGRLLFCYTMADGQTLDFRYFWAGRVSCKRAFVTQHGIFRQELRAAALEDIELGYRLSRHGLKVIFCRNAVQYMNRPITYDEFCRRCERQGKAQYLFGRLYPGNAVVEKYCRLGSARERWTQIKENLGMSYYRVREFEAHLACEPNNTNCPAIRAELRKLYRETFDGFRLKGIVQEEDEASSATPAARAPVVEPVVIFQMGKVGSKTVENSLAAVDLSAPVCHCHRLRGFEDAAEKFRERRSNPEQALNKMKLDRQLAETVLGTSYIRCRLISLVRDPVARNISAFFQGVTAFIPEFFRRCAERDLPLEELQTAFLDRYEHDTPLLWFPNQLQPVFGIDVFARAFPKERGYDVYEAETCRLLVIKLEMLDACAAEAMREFLGIQNFALSNANAAEEKDYKDIYKAFLRSIVLPEDYLNRMYESAFARHFYTDTELQHFRARWMARNAGPVDHSLRKSVENYSWAEAVQDQNASLVKESHYRQNQCLRAWKKPRFPTRIREASMDDPLISVDIPTVNRAELRRAFLESLYG